MVNSVPFFIGSNGAKHPAEVLRAFAYAATQGAEGVIGADDMLVAAQALPGGSVQIAPGGCVILNRSPGSTFQSYVEKVIYSETLAIAPTGSGGGRSDLIIRRIEDPDYPGWSVPIDPVNGPYSRYAVISGVANTVKRAKELNLSYPAIELARIDLPPSTATVMPNHIIPLRKVANPRRQREVDAIFPTGSQAVVSTVWMKIGSSRAILIPDWATWATVRGDFTGLALTVNNALGDLTVNLGPMTGAGQPTLYDENWSTTGTYSRNSYVALGEFPIPANLRGTAQTLDFFANRRGGTGHLQIDVGTSLFADVEFLEKAY